MLLEAIQVELPFQFFNTKNIEKKTILSSLFSRSLRIRGKPYEAVSERTFHSNIVIILTCFSYQTKPHERFGGTTIVTSNDAVSFISHHLKVFYWSPLLCFQIKRKDCVMFKNINQSFEKNRYLVNLCKSDWRMTQFIFSSMDEVSWMEEMSSYCRTWTWDSIFSLYCLPLSEPIRIFAFLGLRLGFCSILCCLLILLFVFFPTIPVSSIPVVLIPALFFNRDPLNAFGARSCWNGCWCLDKRLRSI